MQTGTFWLAGSRRARCISDRIIICVLLASHAIKKVKTIDAMLIFTIEPILNPVWVYLFIGETPGHWALVGGVLVLTALVARGVYIARTRNTGPHR